MRQACSLWMYGGGHPPTTASAFAHCSSLTSSNFSRNSNSNPEPTASVATGTSRAGKFGQRMRIAMTSPWFDVGRLCLGVGDAHGLGNTGRTLLALDLDGPLVCHANAAVWHVVGREPLLAAADARTNLHGSGETHLVRAVVYAVPHIVDLEDIPAEGSDHGQGKIAVCDGLAIRHVRLAALDINMDPLMVAACVGKCVDAFLCHDQPVAHPQLLTDHRLHL